MANHTPQEMSPANANVIHDDAMALAIPTQEPPSVIAMAMAEALDQQARPTVMLPMEVAMAEATAAATWHSGKKVTGLWTINQNRNAWLGLAGVSGWWRKLADNTDSNIVALNMLAAHAKQTNATVNAYEDDTGKLTQLYVW